jgi:hypothetical protein
MKMPLCIVPGAVFLACFGFASGQVPSRDFPDAANPTAAPPAANSPRSGTPDRPPAATLPEANAPDPAITGQAPTPNSSPFAYCNVAFNCSTAASAQLAFRISEP